jgi:hypothetical protein
MNIAFTVKNTIRKIRMDAFVSGPAETTKSKEQQKREWLQLYLRVMLTRSEYTLYRFHEKGKDYPYMLNFLTENDFFLKVSNSLNDPKWKDILDNKWLFQVHYGRFGIPIPEVYGIYDSTSGFHQDGSPLNRPEHLRAFFQEVRPSALVAKPLGGICGKQLLILKEICYRGDDFEAVTNTGHILSFEDVARILDHPPEVRFYHAGGYQLNMNGYLLQAKLEQHPFLNEIAPYTTNTVRVVTFLDHKGDVDIHFTVLRAGRKGNMADNWDRGGLAIAVDPKTGALGRGMLKPKYGGHWMDTHPDTGTPFVGRQIPHWNEIIDICTKAARVSPNLRSIGWDVALTPTGPVLIEGNPDWDLQMVQVHSDGYLQPKVREQFSHFGLTFPEKTLPPINLVAWRQRWSEQQRILNFYGQFYGYDPNAEYDLVKELNKKAPVESETVQPSVDIPQSPVLR